MFKQRIPPSRASGKEREIRIGGIRESSGRSEREFRCGEAALIRPLDKRSAGSTKAIRCNAFGAAEN
jgi:hypothetical protein